MTSEMITTIFASSVIASFISATIAYYQFKKNNQLVFITSERKEWRANIRNIAERIELSKTYEDVEKPLVDLKVRINAYGRNSRDVMQDAHIWNTIDKLEKRDGDFKQLKKLLILYLSMLLKMDWERSKEEVRGNGFQMILYLIVLIAAISFAYKYLISLNLSVDSPFVIAVLILTYPITMLPRKGMNTDKALEWFSKDNSFIKKFGQSMSMCLLAFIGMTVAICFFNKILLRMDEFILCIVFLFLAFLVRFLREYRQYSLEVYYYENILMCKIDSKDQVN